MMYRRYWRAGSIVRPDIVAASQNMLGPGVFNTGIGNAALVRKGDHRIMHVGSLHHAMRSSLEMSQHMPWNKLWLLIKKVDLWETFYHYVEHKGPESVTITRVKGHATDETAQSSPVKSEDKFVTGWACHG